MPKMIRCNDPVKRRMILISCQVNDAEVLVSWEM